MEATGDLRTRVVKQFGFALRDTNPSIRFLALEGMERFPDPSLTDQVLPLLEDKDKYVRWKAIQVAGLLGLAAFRPPLEMLLQSPDPTTRSLAAQALGTTGQVEVLPALLDLAGREGSPRVRQTVIRNLHRFGGQIPWTYLAQAIRDPDLGVRIDTATTLGNAAPHDQACDLLINLLEQESNNHVFATALMSLGRFRKEILVGYYQHSLLHQEPRIRANAVEAMGNLPFRTVEQLVLPYLRDPSNRVKANVMGIYLQNGLGPRVIGEVRALLVSPHRWERASGAWLIGTYRVTELTASLFGLLNDEEPAVAERAAWALGQVRTPGLFEDLLREWGKARQWAIPAFLSAFRRVARLENVPALVSLLEKDRNPRTKAAMIDNLTALRAVMAKPAVEKLIWDPEQRIRLSALLFMAGISGTSANDMLVRALDDPSPRVRQLCAEVLLEKGDFRGLRTLAALLTDPEKQQRVMGGLALRDLAGGGSGVIRVPGK